jgi:hypothetical protein
MQGKHWVCIIVAIVIGYALGVYFPSYGQKAVAAVGA